MSVAASHVDDSSVLSEEARARGGRNETDDKSGSIGVIPFLKGGYGLLPMDAEMCCMKPEVPRTYGTYSHRNSFGEDTKLWSVPMIDKTLNDLFLAQLKDIFFAEKQIYKTLPKMVKATKAPALKQAFAAHREETQGHIERLEEVFEMIGKRPQTKPCEAIKGIISEGEETIEDFGSSMAIDAGLIAAGQAVEHYEMARYGALIAWAKQMNLPKAAALLNETLQEEIKADRLLTQIGASEAAKMAA
jgi:ferritin-like metal-binding protein YciE